MIPPKYCFFCGSNLVDENPYNDKYKQCENEKCCKLSWKAGAFDELYDPYYRMDKLIVFFIHENVTFNLFYYEYSDEMWEVRRYHLNPVLKSVQDTCVTEMIPAPTNDFDTVRAHLATLEKSILFL